MFIDIIIDKLQPKVYRRLTVAFKKMLTTEVWFSPYLELLLILDYQFHYEIFSQIFEFRSVPDGSGMFETDVLEKIH